MNGYKNRKTNLTYTGSVENRSGRVLYLLQKKHQLANYEERHARGEWIANTRVEKWNDIAVSGRCKHRSMSWTETGVLAIATYAENDKKSQKIPQLFTPVREHLEIFSDGEVVSAVDQIDLRIASNIATRFSMGVFA